MGITILRKITTPVPGNVVHCRKARFDYYIGRNALAYGFIEQDADLANPWHIGQDGTRSEVVARFETYARTRMVHDLEFRTRLRSMHGKTLGCWCAPLLCHGTVILKLAHYIHERETQRLAG